MNIILLGYSARIDIENHDEIKTAKGDVAIEFSHPDAAYENISQCLERGIPVVSGTTGWLNRKSEIEDLCNKKGGSFFYASNYSLGVNIFFKLNEYLAKVMNTFDDYSISLEEIHHAQKKDAPSGTAITLAEGVLNHVGRKARWVNTETQAKDELPIISLRTNEVPGTHTVTYSSAVDDIEIKHTAHSRQGFALGAVLVAEWIRSKKGVLNMNDFLKF